MKRVGIFFSLVLILIFVSVAVASDTEPTDVQQPGTQPGQVSLEGPDRCSNCHSGYDTDVEPYSNWMGSMMAQAGRDPIFWATLAIAEQDFDGVGDMCIRCHSASGWINGNSTPTDGSGLGPSDANGVDCDFCHKMTNTDNGEHLGVMVSPFIANDGGTPTIGYYGTGMVSLWNGSEKLGPYAETVARHKFTQSSFHRSQDFCGSCHDVSNPVVGDLAPNHGTQSTADAVVASGVLGGPVEDKAAFNNFPYMYGVVERTYSEYYAGALSTFRVAEYATLPADLQSGAIEAAYLASGGDYEDGTPRYYTCQTCHMSAVTGAGADMNNAPIRTDLPLHDLTGGNYWIPDAIQYQDNLGILRLGGGLSTDIVNALNAGKLRALNQLSLAADLSVTDDTLKVVNLTGHKLISGYPEGRRMWLDIKWYDSSNTLLREDGEYGDMVVQIDGSPVIVRSILDLEDENTVVYEAHYGMTQEWAAALISLGYSSNLALSYDRETGVVIHTLGSLAAATSGLAEETFHFALNNTILKDNRIPPYGFSYDEARVRNALPVPADQYGGAGAGSTYNYWDEVALNPPSGAVYAEINLMYQPTSWEYIQFLYLGNDQQSAFLGQEGVNMLDTWLNTGMAEPEVMASTTWGAMPPETYTLTINVVGNGSVSKDPDKTSYTLNEIVELTATADPGWTFAGWSGDLTGSTNPDSITMDADKTVTATFTQDGVYTLSVNIVGNGSVSKNPDKSTYTLNEIVELTATADPGWTFAGWSGDLTGSTNPESITMDGNKTVTATFTQDAYTLTINTVGNGSVSKNPDQSTYVYGDSVELTATADPGWTFAGWSGDLTGTTNPDSIIMDGNKTVTATFTQDAYTLTINTVGNGSVSKNPDQSTYSYGDSVELTATADPGWTFAGWSGDLTGSTNPDSITMDGDKSVTATFTQDAYTLAISTVGNGSVSKNPDQSTYVYGDSVELTATADPGWTFAGWSGDLTGSTNPESITMDGNKTVTATFTQDAYTLTVNTVGNGSVSKNPDQSTYVYGDSVELTATADPGWTFAGWSGDLTGSTNPESITMDGNKTVTATFTQDAYTLTFNTVGNGSVSKNPDQSTYTYGDSVELTATADPGWTFAGWSGDLSGSTNPESITMDGNKTVTATFTQDDVYTLSFNVVGNGSVSKNPDKSTYTLNEIVELTATADPGWTFAGWSGDLSGSTNPDSITMDGNKTVTATFTQDAYTLTINTVGNGSVSKNPDQSTYSYGDSVELTATADPGWTFAGWSGDLSGSTNPDSITMDGNKTVTATFTQDAYTLTVNIVGNGSVSKNPDQLTYVYGDSVELTATADPGWTFAGWSGDLTSTTNPDSITMDGNKTVTATFTQDAYTLTINTVGNGSVSKNPDQLTYVYGDSVELTATADPGWTFAGWSGDLSGSTNPDSITMDGNKTVTATFTQDDVYTLSVNVVGNGLVSKNPDKSTYTLNEIVELTATADPGWTFAGWSGDLTGTTNPDSIIMGGNKTVTATFSENGVCETPGTPALSSPVDDTALSNATPLFEWDSVVNASEYQIQIDTNNSFTAPVSALETALQHTAAAMEDGLYYWRVRGHNTQSGCDVYGAWSDIWTITIDTVKPSGAFVSPANSEYIFIKPRAILNVSTSDAQSSVVSVAYSAFYDSAWHVIFTDENAGDGWLYYWVVDGVADQTIHLQAVITDAAGNQETILMSDVLLQSTLTFGNGYQTRGTGQTEDFCPVNIDAANMTELSQIFTSWETPVFIGWPSTQPD